MSEIRKDQEKNDEEMLPNVHYCAGCRIPFQKSSGGNIVQCSKCGIFNCYLCQQSPAFSSYLDCQSHIDEVHTSDIEY